MLDLTQILSQLWFLVAFLVFIMFFNIVIKKLKEKARKKRFKEFVENNISKGIEYEKKCGKIYEEKGYEVEYNGLDNGKKDGGIDLISSKNGETKILIQCKNYSEEKSIDHEKIKVFHSNATKFMDLNNLDRKRVELKYIVPDVKVFDNSALKVFKNKYYNCRYEII